MKVKAKVDFWGAGALHHAGDVVEHEDATAWLRDGVVELVEDESETGAEVMEPAPVAISGDAAGGDELAAVPSPPAPVPEPPEPESESVTEKKPEAKAKKTAAAPLPPAQKPKARPKKK